MSRPMVEFGGNCQFSGFSDGGIYLAPGVTAEVRPGGNLTISHTGGHGVTVGGDMYTQRSGVQGMVSYDFSIRNNRHSTVEDFERMCELLNLPSLSFLRDDLIELLFSVRQNITCR